MTTKGWTPPTAALPSVASTAPARQFDPWTDGLMWSGGTSASWTHRKLDLRRRRLGEGFDVVSIDGHKHAAITPEQAQELLIRGAWRTVHQAVLAAVLGWRIATVEQLVTITGLTPGRVREALTVLYSADLIEIGAMPAVTQWKRKFPSIIKPIRGDALDDLLAQIVPDDAWLRIGPNEAAHTNRHPRHGLLATELGLRAAERLGPTGLGAVAGEHLALSRSLVGEGHGSAGADVVLVREDGLRICVEVTASKHRLEKKIDAWIDALASQDPDELGVFVLWLSAERTPVGQRRTDKFATGVKTAIVERINARFVEGKRERIIERMGHADWTSWFPEAGVIDPSFSALTVEAPAGPDGAEWERVDLLDPFEVPFEPSDPASWKEVVERINGLWQSPPPLRSVSPVKTSLITRKGTIRNDDGRRVPVGVTVAA